MNPLKGRRSEHSWPITTNTRPGTSVSKVDGVSTQLNGAVALFDADEFVWIRRRVPTTETSVLCSRGRLGSISAQILTLGGLLSSTECWRCTPSFFGGRCRGGSLSMRKEGTSVVDSETGTDSPMMSFRPFEIRYLRTVVQLAPSPTSRSPENGAAPESAVPSEHVIVHSMPAAVMSTGKAAAAWRTAHQSHVLSRWLGAGDQETARTFFLQYMYMYLLLGLF